MRRTVKAWVANPFKGSFWVGQDCRNVWRYKPMAEAQEVEITYDDGRKPAPRKRKGGGK